MAEKTAQSASIIGSSRVTTADLTQAAMLGRSFLDLYNSTDLVRMAQSLKVLNALRYYEVGIPLTYQQYVRPILATK